MAKKIKSLKMESIETVKPETVGSEGSAPVVESTIMSETKEVTMSNSSVSMPAAESTKYEPKVIFAAELPLEFFGVSIPVQLYDTGTMVFGRFTSSKKQLVLSPSTVTKHTVIDGVKRESCNFDALYGKIEAILNGLGGLRTGHYAVVEPGVHLLSTVEELKTQYSGRFGYVDFEFASPEWTAWFASKSIKPVEGRSGYTAVEVEGKGKLRPGFILDNHNLMTLEHRAEKMGKTVSQLSPITISNHNEIWNTFNKREAMDLIIDIVKNGLQVFAKYAPAKEGDWRVGHIDRRFRGLFGTVEEVATMLNKSANNGKAQVSVNQGAWVTKNDASQAPVIEEKAQALEIAIYGTSEKMTPAQLVRTNVTRMRGDMELVSFGLMNVEAAVKQVEYAVAEGLTLRVNRRF